jgi:nicotinate-nucleotide--dimethylbenzimidazole phosphoribosyltransferase
VNSQSLSSPRVDPRPGVATNDIPAFAPVSPVDEATRAAAGHRLDTLTKPQGALGRLELLAAQVCAVQRTLHPAVTQPVAFVFAGDHGVADRGVSAYPRAVTVQMVRNFLVGGAAINVLAQTLGIELWIVDAGIDGDLPTHPRLIDAKIRRGTRDFVDQAAMTTAECSSALQRGAEIIASSVSPASNVVVLGEMGIGNTASAALLMHGLTGIPIHDCVGRGTGLDDRGFSRKKELLTAAWARRPPPVAPAELLREFGGYEIAMMTGAALAAAARRMLIVVDGFTVTASVALAARIDPNVLGYCVFAHCSAERAHRAVLAHIGVQPLLDLEMRLGEGTGAALALPLVRAAAALFTEMATFDGARVSGKVA